MLWFQTLKPCEKKEVIQKFEVRDTFFDLSKLVVTKKVFSTKFTTNEWSDDTHFEIIILRAIVILPAYWNVYK